MSNLKKFLSIFLLFCIPVLVSANPIPYIPPVPSIEMIIAIFVSNLLFNFFVGLSGFSLFNKTVKNMIQKYFIIVLIVTLIGVMTGYFTVLFTYGNPQFLPFLTVTTIEFVLFTVLFSIFKIFSPKQSLLISFLIVSLGLMVGFITRLSIETPITPLSV